MGRLLAIVFGIFILLMLIGKCAGSPEPDAETPSTDLPTADLTMSPTQPPTMQGEAVSVPTDPGATYRLLEWRKLPNGHREALTRRDGPSGTSFARREIDCQAMQFRYLGEGDTIEEARLDRPEPPGPMGDLTEGSISTYVSEFVCRK